MLAHPFDAAAIATCAASRKVIVRHSVLVAGASLIRIPLVDSLTVTAVQLLRIVHNRQHKKVSFQVNPKP